MKTSKVTIAILKFVAEAGFAMLDAFFPPQYPEAKLARSFLGLDPKPRKYTKQEYYQEKNRISSMLYHLKQQGLIISMGPRQKTIWKITARGKKYLEMSDCRIKNELKPLPEDGILRLVIFDIPEKQRHDRNRVRSALVSCNFKQLQKSVWIGKNPLPENFLKEVDDLGLTKCIHLISVDRKGTLTAKT